MRSKLERRLDAGNRDLNLLKPSSGGLLAKLDVAWRALPDWVLMCGEGSREAICLQARRGIITHFDARG